MRPSVSVIIPTRGVRPAGLLRCVLSVLTQGVEGVEVIVSGDGTQKHFTLLGGIVDSRIVPVSSSEQRGAAAARNLGLRCARGKIILFIDDDDWMLPGHIREVLAFFAAKPRAKAAFGRSWAVIPLNRTEEEAERIRQQRAEWKLWAALPNYDPIGLDKAFVERNRISVFPPPYYVAEKLSHHNPWPTLAVAVKMECYQEVGGWNEEIPVCEDWEMWVRIGDEFAWYDMKPPPRTAYTVRLLEEVDRPVPPEEWPASVHKVREQAMRLMRRGC